MILREAILIAVSITRRVMIWSYIYLLLYVDNMLIAAKDGREIRQVKEQLSKEFDMKDLGATKKILEIEIQINRKEGKLYLSQKGYIQKVFYRLNM